MTSNDKKCELKIMKVYDKFKVLKVQKKFEECANNYKLTFVGAKCGQNITLIKIILK